MHLLSTVLIYLTVARASPTESRLLTRRERSLLAQRSTSALRYASLTRFDDDANIPQKTTFWRRCRTVQAPIRAPGGCGSD
ncbi:hypothetical protein F5882DRAFT_411969 [Hyaloscypha sp. PMI_1271]|nr:hypothetical protein F5882DRAFT_411969 [Hyaloscypha sp. PMI_1271]